MAANLNLGRVGMPWYTAIGYDRARSVMVDRHLMPPSFEDWQAGAERALDEVRRQGYVPVKAIVDHLAFPLWCRLRKLPCDAVGRARFASAWIGAVDPV
jgi:hypothetical protein